MAGIDNLKILLKNMNPAHVKGEYVFCTFRTQSEEPSGANSILRFKEREGVTLILPRREADKLKLKYEQVWALVTLAVHSDLEAVGFLAAVTKALAEANICVNVVSAYFHDHLFVPKKQIRKAMRILRRIS